MGFGQGAENQSKRTEKKDVSTWEGRKHPEKMPTDRAGGRSVGVIDSKNWRESGKLKEKGGKVKGSLEG